MSLFFSRPRDLAKDHVVASRAFGIRQAKTLIFGAFLGLALIVAVLSLVVMVGNMLDGAFGFVAISYVTPQEELVLEGKTIDKQDRDDLIRTLMIQTEVYLDDDEKGLSPRRLDALSEEKPLEQRTREELKAILVQEVLQPRILHTWGLMASIFDRKSIEAWHPDDEEDQDFRLEFRSWVMPDFITGNQSPDAVETGVRTALLGSVWIIILSLLVAFPIGVGAAVFLEEFVDSRNWFARIVQVNIYNLAGVPSIIYGILGLSIFVRAGAELTQGRSILSASLTLGLLILPVIIINSQEAIRAVPKSLRDSSMGLGATRLQTIWHHVLPQAMERILTGTILAISRALGETAPLVVVGAATFLQEDPTSPFSAFSALPIQIYQWTARPQAEFRSVAAAAIIVLMLLLLALNGTAIGLRGRLAKKRSTQ